jgi:hypothetical protein
MQLAWRSSNKVSSQSVGNNQSIYSELNSVVEQVKGWSDRLGAPNPTDAHETESEREREK